MTTFEFALTFPCEDAVLVGVLSQPETPLSDLGVVIVVGGPQTRVGSHRQFVRLSHALARAGYPVLRFDVRGMGDSAGNPRTFEQLTADIGAAIDTLVMHCPSVHRVVLWGLCDAASAALLYSDETRDQRIAGLCLLNPWVRSDASLARTQVKHYYVQRLLQKEFWMKLLSGRLNVFRSIPELLRKLGQATVKAEPYLGFQARMARGWQHHSGPTLLILSGDDYTAKEFLEYASNNENWRSLLKQAGVTRIDIAAANHTFSSQEWRKTVENACIDWLTRYG